jgi:hypothetical protein
MQNSEPLAFLGWAVIVVSMFAIIVPILRGRSDALTFWNMFLMGGIIFIGIGCLEVVYGTFEWAELKWFQPSRKDVQILVLGTILFYITVFSTYYLLDGPIQKFTGRFLNKWPPSTLSVTLLMVGLMCAITVGALLSRGIIFVGPLLINVSQKVVVFAVVFTFCHWYQNKRQLPMLGLFLGVFCYCLLFAMVIYIGRRLMMSIVGVPLICMYWLKWRYASPKRIVLVMAAAAAFVFCTTVFYSTFRHARSINSPDATRSFSTVFDAMMATGLTDVIDHIQGNTLHFFSQYTMHYSLLTIHLVERGDIPVEPLNTIKFVFSYPIPRAIWPNKPDALGGRIVRDVLQLTANTNWGLGFVAHGYQEGGYVVIAFYGFLVVVLIRVLDDAMRRQPDNRFLLATFCAGAPHVLGLVRGDICTMTVEILEAFAFVWIVGLSFRFVFGTEPAQNRTAVPRPPFESLGGQAYLLKR